MKIYKVIENGIEYDVEEKQYINDFKSIQFFYNGIRHRELGPAVEYSYGEKNSQKVWWKNGHIHRENGPASISYGENQEYYEEYYLNGIYYPDVSSPEELIIASVII